MVIEKYGKWTVLENNGSKWLCICDCGITKHVYKSSLLNKRSNSCMSCAKKKYKIQIGEKFGKWTVIEELRRQPRPNLFITEVLYLCKCECGTIRKLRARPNGLNSTECDKCSQFTHNFCKHPLYRTYLNMISRCKSSKHSRYKYYGGRGIKVCDRWLNSFMDFVSDIGIKPEGHSLDRINNDGNYEPNNCKWSTKSEQGKNRRKLKTSL